MARAELQQGAIRSFDSGEAGEAGMARRGFLCHLGQRLALLLLLPPLASLSGTVARAERQRRHHRGPRHPAGDPLDELWIGHC